MDVQPYSATNPFRSTSALVLATALCAVAGHAHAQGFFSPAGGSGSKTVIIDPRFQVLNPVVIGWHPATAPSNWVQVTGTTLIATDPRFGWQTYRVDYVVSPNPTNTYRSLDLADVGHFRQGCASISLSSSRFPAKTTQQRIDVHDTIPDVVAPQDCSWGTATSDQAWAKITTGSGTGNVPIMVELDRSFTAADRTAIISLGPYHVALVQEVSESYVVLRERDDDFRRGSFGLRKDEIPGIDHVGMSWEKTVYESHPHMRRGSTSRILTPMTTMARTSWVTMAFKRSIRRTPSPTTRRLPRHTSCFMTR